MTHTPPPPGCDSPLDAQIAPHERRHEAQSGFRLVPEGAEAFAIRAHSARIAARSIDVQTYIWHDDMTGAGLAHLLVEAADRGVRVRLLVDDMDARGRNFVFAALDAHPHIEVRLFNPFFTRRSALLTVVEAVLRFRRINRRMHNKNWIVDNRLAVTGGRNLGDEYFGGGEETNFVDLDFALVGPVVREASVIFEQYWNAPDACPMAKLSPGQVTAGNLARLRERLSLAAGLAVDSRYARELRSSDAVQRLLSGDWPLRWSSRYRLVADDPRKVSGARGGYMGSHVLELLAPLIGAARSDITLVSPYFVPGKQGTEAFVSRVAAGCRVRVLTNSLAANDVAAVYGGYTKWRRPLLRGAVQLWELKPDTGSTSGSSMFGSSGASLHTKALVIDAHTVFVGSYNIDARSTSLNCEQGVFVEEPALAAELGRLFAQYSAGNHAWSVTLEHGRLCWSDGQTTQRKPPEASLWRRFQALLARALPVESQL